VPWEGTANTDWTVKKSGAEARLGPVWTVAVAVAARLTCVGQNERSLATVSLRRAAAATATVQTCS
jgi:hypothetical protein